MTFDKFRYPLAVLQIFRKHSLNHAADMALQWAREPVTREEARAWVLYLRDTYKRESFDDLRVS